MSQGRAVCFVQGSSMNLAEFLRARIDEDESAIRGLRDQERLGNDPLADAFHHASTGFLADLAAKRRLIDPAIPDEWSEIAAANPSAHQAALALLALPYRGHRDYDDRWRP